MPTKQELNFADQVLNSNIDFSSMINDVKNWVQSNFNPEDIFSTTELDKWAESEGYTKPENNG